jgi:L-2-hydroxyglutarate oxidase LhgO
MRALQDDAGKAGATVALRTPLVSGAVRDGGGFDLSFGDGDATRLACRTLVNCAGLHAPDLARRMANLGGIESPGLTASLAIARHVASLLPT